MNERTCIEVMRVTVVCVVGLWCYGGEVVRMGGGEGGV